MSQHEDAQVVAHGFVIYDNQVTIE